MRDLHGIAIALLAVAGISACSKAPSVLPSNSVEVQKDSNKNRLDKLSFEEIAAINNDLELIGESAGAVGYQIWLKKDFWLNRSIWISLGIEKASVTGLAVSVMGYVPARLEKHGNLLVLKQENQGLFGGSVLDPEFGLNAYPILAENDSALLVDLAKPQNPYGLSSMGFHVEEHANTELKPRLEYIKNVSVGEKSLSYKTVLQAVSPKPLYREGSMDPEDLIGQDPYSLAMTIRTDWMLPSESPNFRPKRAIEQGFGFFTTSPRLTPDGLDTVSHINKIDTSKKMLWTLSANTPAEHVKAVTDGVTSWNKALGEDLLEVELAKEVRDITDTRSSNVIWDDNQGIGYAFANWRENPLTGEVVQGQVYMSGAMWAEGARITYQIRNIIKELQKKLLADTTKVGVPEHSEEKLEEGIRLGGDPFSFELEEQIGRLKKRVSNLSHSTKSVERRFIALNPSLSKEMASHKGHCQRALPDAGLQAVIMGLEDAILSLDTPNLSELENVEETLKDIAQYYPVVADDVSESEFVAGTIRAVVMHEVGHVLGLRHNFRASTETSKEGTLESGSIMDYNDSVVDAKFVEPGDSDKAVIDMGYFNKFPAKAFAFCTDEDTRVLPDCQPFDHGSDPVKFYNAEQKIHVLLSDYLFRNGNMFGGMRMLERSLSSTRSLMKYVSMDENLGKQYLGDFNFSKTQEKAWNAILEGRRLFDLPLSDDFKTMYEDLSRMLVGSRTTRAGSQSAVSDKLVTDLQETLLDSRAIHDRFTRERVLEGSVELQSAQGRKALKDVSHKLRAQAEDDSRPLENLMLDESLLAKIENLLDGHYYKGN